MKEVCEFLKKCGAYYLATTDGDQPRVRPFGTAHIIDGKLEIQTGKSKNVFREITANPKVEIVACKPDGHWLRYTGRAVFETDPKYAEAALDAMPHLRDIYNEETGYKMMMFHLEDAKAVDIAVMGEGVELLD